MARSEAPTANYGAAQIDVLEGLEPVRKRPGMYIGGTEGPEGLHHLVKEILDNSVDEAMNGFADCIDVILHKDLESVTIKDNGRGIPVDTHPKFKKSALEIVLTTLHAGGKFSETNYRSAGGLHGVGASVVNALSETLVATVWRDGFEWQQSFCRGIPKTKLEKGAKSKEHGTQIFFKPDNEIFRTIKFNAARIQKIVQEKAFLNRGLKLNFLDEATAEKTTYCYEDGLKSYLSSMLETQKLSPVAAEQFYFERANGIKIEVAFCWTEATQEKVLSYVNGIHTAQGGSHDDGFKAGLSKALRNYISVHELSSKAGFKNLKIIGEDIREGLLAVLSVNIPGAVSQLQFQGQTKDKLNNPEVTEPVETLMRGFENELNSRPNVANLIVERVISAARARTAARAAADSVSRKIGVSHRLNLPGKLADCSTNSPEESELLIVEGDSAGGTAKQGRDRNFQAVLPLRGKILNSISAGDAKLKENRELLDLVSAIGCGYGEGLSLKKLRYDKVIILTDADADGMHIASLLMAFFFSHMKPLVQAGHVYLGRPPLYRIRIGAGAKAEEHWVYTDEEKEKLVRSKGSRAIHVTRFKGLGEMNTKALWDTTLNPRTRNLLKIRIDDEAEAVLTFEQLLGKDSSERYRLIQENAHRLELDL